MIIQGNNTTYGKCVNCVQGVTIMLLWNLFHTLKVELVHGENYRSKNEASSSIAYYIEAYYNRKRRHSAINYNIPLLYESFAVAA